MSGRTGIFPATFGGQTIKYRIPYSMPGELQLAASLSGQAFPEATFFHQIDKPFEIWRMRVTVTALLDGVILATQPGAESLRRRARVNINDTCKNEQLTKAAQILDTLVAGPTEDPTWEWYVPYTIEKSEGFQIVLDTLAYDAAFNALRFNFCFQGYLIVLQPASNTR